MVTQNNKKNDTSLLVIATFIFVISLLLHKNSPYPEIQVSKQESAVTIDKNLVKYFSLGCKRMISTLIWIKTLLDSDEVHYGKSDRKNWMYHRFMTIAELDPEFYENYLWGGMYLSIVKDDVVGGLDLYELGLKEYPEDYSLRYNTGFNYFFEMDNHKKGLEHLEKIEHHPRTPWPIRFIIQKLRFESTKDYDSTISFIRLLKETNKDPVVTAKLKNDLYAIIAMRDLECLNQNKSGCNLVDSEGNRYIRKEGTWTAQKKYKPYKIFKKSN